jgi:hypothetical protein
MKRLAGIPLFLCLIGFAACSNQVTDLHKVQALRAISEVTHKISQLPHDTDNDRQILKPDPIALPLHETAQTHNPRQSFLFNSYMHFSVAAVPPIKPFKCSFAFPHKIHIASAETGRINKAGFILIGAGILALVLHLIPVAGIILIVLGLIILLAPLFRKKPY